MALNKREMTQHISQNTALTYAQSRAALDALLDAWFETLAAGGTIAVDDFLILRVQRIERDNPGQVLRNGALVDAGRMQQRIQVRVSEKLKQAMKSSEHTTT